MKEITVALIQHPPVFLNLKASVEKACSLIDEAAAKPADLVLFPETWLPGYPIWLDTAPNVGLWDHPPVKKLYRVLVNNALHQQHPLLEKLQQKIARAQVPVVLGAHETVGSTLYNTLFYFQKDGSYTLHRKLIPTYTERLIWGRGDGSTLNTMQTDFGTVGGLICWEHWMPAARAAIQANKEQVHVAQWPYVKELHQLCSRHYAFEGQCFVAACGGILTKNQMLEGIRSLNLPKGDHDIIDFIESIPTSLDELLLKGGSALIAPDTSYIVKPKYGETGIFYGQANLNQITEGNMFIDGTGHYARPDIFQLQVNTAPQENVSFSHEENSSS